MGVTLNNIFKLLGEIDDIMRPKYGIPIYLELHVIPSGAGWIDFLDEACQEKKIASWTNFEQAAAQLSEYLVNLLKEREGIK